MKTDFLHLIGDAAIITAAAGALALTVNTLRANGLPLIAANEFEILVPCPEPSGTATALAADDPKLRAPTTLVIDARCGEEYTTWHWPSAISVPFDWLAEHEQIEMDAHAIARRTARTGKHSVIVYGDGEDPDSGKQWAGLLIAAGIKNVFYVKGGSVALRGQTIHRERAP